MPSNTHRTNADTAINTTAQPAARAMAAEQRRHLTTEEFAQKLGMSAQTLRKRYSQTGSYFSVRPIKLPNRRLLWPANAVEQLIGV